jgi:hypothetical protein
LANFLTDTIRAVVRAEVFDPVKSKGKLYGRPRLFNDLLSSQPLAFNLFGELQQDLTLSTRVFRDLTHGRIERVTAIDFEYSPGRSDARYTGDKSAFDVYVTFETPTAGRGFVGIEVKYHENMCGGPGDHHEQYKVVADEMGCFRTDRLVQIQQSPLEQIWRDHLLAGSHLQKDGFDDGFFAILFPRDNQYCAEAVGSYRACLQDDDTFIAWTIEDIYAAILNHTSAEWVTDFYRRYLDFPKLLRQEQ